MESEIIADAGEADKKPDIVFVPKIHPLLASLPAHLKDPANYEEINKLIVHSLAGKHSHGEIMEWAGCAQCQRRFAERGKLLKKLGFKHPAQYMLWKKVHEEIGKRFPLIDWKTRKTIPLKD